MSVSGFISYKRVNWTGQTPWNPTNLNIMDKGIKDNNDMISTLKDEVSALNSNNIIKYFTYNNSISTINNDMNDIRDTGIYSGINLLNAPDNSNSWITWINLCANGNNNFCTQIAVKRPAMATPYIYIRDCFNGNWTEWRKI